MNRTGMSFKCLDSSLTTELKEQLSQDEEFRNAIVEAVNAIRKVEEESGNLYTSVDSIARRGEASPEQLHSIELRIFALKDRLHEVRDTIESFKSMGLLTEECYKEITEYLSQLHETVEIVEKRLRSLLNRIPGIQANTVYDELNIRLGLPVFSANLHGASLSVKLVKGVTASARFNSRNKDCEISLQQEDYEEDNSDPVSALYKLTPLSVVEARGRLAYTLVPPADRDEGKIRFHVYLGYAAPWRKGVYVCNCIGANECRPDGCARKKEQLLRWVAKLLFNKEDVGKDLILGLDVNAVNIPEYGSAYRALFCGDCILAVFKVHVYMWGRPHHFYTIVFMKNGYDASSATLPVGVCTLGDEMKIFVGLPLEVGDRRGQPVFQPIFYVKCPLVTLYEQARQQGNERYMKLLESICSRLPACFRERNRALVVASDVYGHLINTRPVMETSIDVNTPISNLSLGAFKADIVKGTVTIGYDEIVIESRYVGERLLYPLPFALRAWIQDTYALLIRPEKRVVDKIVNDIIEEIVARKSGSVYTRQLFVKLALAAGGLSSKDYWDGRLSRLLLSRNARDVKVGLEMLVYLARRVADRVAAGESYVLTLSGLRRAAALLMDLAVDVDSRGEPTRLKDLVDAFAELVARNDRVRRNLETFLGLSAEFSLAHYVAYCVGGMREYLDALELRVTRDKSGRIYALVEKRQGGIGYLATLDENSVRECLIDCRNIINDVARKVTGQRRQGINLRASVLSDITQVLEEISLRVAKAYGQVDSRSKNVRYTYIPAWLVRLVLTEDKLREYAERMGIKLQSGFESTWRMIQHEIVAEYFDTDLMDASQYDIAGVSSWAGEYEKKVLLNNRYALQMLMFIR